MPLLHLTCSCSLSLLLSSLCHLVVIFLSKHVVGLSHLSASFVFLLHLLCFLLCFLPAAGAAESLSFAHASSFFLCVHLRSVCSLQDLPRHLRPCTPPLPRRCVPTFHTASHHFLLSLLLLVFIFQLLCLFFRVFYLVFLDFLSVSFSLLDPPCAHLRAHWPRNILRSHCSFLFHVGEGGTRWRGSGWKKGRP